MKRLEMFVKGGPRAIIVGSGPSARGFQPPEGVIIIAVNGAIDWLSRADYFFTLDPSALNIRRLHYQRHGVIYCAAGINFDIDNVYHFKRVANRGVEPLAKSTPEWWLWRWSSTLGLSEDKHKIHTGNSAYGALGLAYHLGFTEVALIGVDANSEQRVEGGIPGNLTHLPLLFASALSQIDVVSCGEMTGIPRMSLDNWLAKFSRDPVEPVSNSV